MSAPMLYTIGGIDVALAGLTALAVVDGRCENPAAKSWAAAFGAALLFSAAALFSTASVMPT